MNDVQELLVEQIMTPAPTCLSQDCTVGGALAFLVREHYQTAPIVDRRGRLLGVVTRARLVDWLGELLASGAGSTTFEQVMAASVEPAVDTSPLRCAPDARLKDASKALVREHAPAVLVVRDGELCGILTLHDVVRAVAYGDEPGAADHHVGRGRGGCFSPDGLPERVSGPEEDDELAARLERYLPRR